jgi:hypothetical protein
MLVAADAAWFGSGVDFLDKFFKIKENKDG